MDASEKKTSSDFKAVGSVTLILLLCKFLGFLRETLMAGIYGASEITDAFNMVNSSINIFFGFLLSISVAYIPTYLDEKKKNVCAATRFLNTVFTSLHIICLVVCIIGNIMSPLLIRLIAGNFPEETYLLSESFFEVAVFSVLFIAPARILMSHLNANGMYLQANISSLSLSICWIAVILISRLLSNSDLLAWGFILVNFVQYCVLFYMVARDGHSFEASLKITAGVRAMYISAVPVFLSSMISDIAAFVDRLFAAGLPTGSLTMLTYGVELKVLVETLCVTSIISISYSVLSSYVADKNQIAIAGVLGDTIDKLIALVLPVSAGCCILAQSIVIILFNYGALSIEESGTTASIFAAYSLGILPLAIHLIFTNVLYAYKKFMISAVMGGISVSLNILFNSIFVRWRGAVGLALASSATFACVIPLDMYMLSKIIKINIINRKRANNFLKAVIGTAFMVLSLLILNQGLNYVLGGLNQRLKAVVVIVPVFVVGFSVYAIIARIAKYKMFWAAMDDLNILPKKIKHGMRAE